MRKFLISVLLLLASGCAEDGTSPEQVGAVSISPVSVELYPGDSTALTAVALSVGGAVLNNRNVVWISSHPSVATVSSAGVVIARTAGEATATATSEGRSASIRVRVVPRARILAAVSASHAVLGPGHPGMKFAQPVWIRASDSTGAGLGGVQARWEADASAGWVYPTHGTTGPDGRLHGVWIPGAVGDGLLTAFVQGGDVARTITVSTRSSNPPSNPLSALGVTMFNAGDATGYSIDITPHTDPSGTYYASMLWLGGYTGIQRDGSLYRDQLQFSTWDNPSAPARLVEAGPGLTCVAFGNEGSGQACRLQYSWFTEHTYRFELDAVAVSNGRNVTLHVTDLSTGIRTFVGTLFQGGIERLGYVGTFVEQFRHVAPNCLQQPLRSYSFARVLARVNGTWGQITTGLVGRHDPVLTCANVDATVHPQGVRLSTGQRTASDPSTPSEVVIP
jgi:hypothetical protein